MRSITAALGNIAVFVKLLVIALVTGVAGAGAQQPNTPEASMTWGGLDGPPWPIVGNVIASPGSSLTLQIQGAPNQPYLVANAPAGLLANPVNFPGMGLLHVQVNQGLTIFMNGLFPTLGATPLDPFAVTNGSGVSTWTIPLPASLNLHLPALQAVVADPTTPAGSTFTAATDLMVTTGASTGIYVSSTTGSPGNPGSASAPLSTIADGYALAQSQGVADLFVAAGSYNEALLFDAAISVTGGFDPQTWTRAPGSYSQVIVPNEGLRLLNINSITLIRYLDIQSANGTNAAVGDMASIAADVRNCSVDLKFEDCLFTSGAGAAGAAGGSSSSTGNPGNAGFPGLAGLVTLFIIGPSPGLGGLGGPGSGGAFNAGGAGGNGGGSFCSTTGPFGSCLLGTAEPGVNGADGVGPIACANGGVGGGTATCAVATNGTNGTAGTPGADGVNGAPAPTPGGMVVGGNWIPRLSTSGLPGAAGCGGGGGGGGGAAQCLQQFVAGGGGGGGGGGGAGGGPGAGGTEGGASFAVYLFNASPTFESCTFSSAQGGTGGGGGNGAPGGLGGTGAPGGAFAGAVISGNGVGSGSGGSGGDGGDGGAGGGGGGAHGGPSFCVMKAGTSAPVGMTDPSNVFLPGVGGLGGAGGAGGTAAAPSGLTGPSGNVGNL